MVLRIEIRKCAIASVLLKPADIMENRYCFSQAKLFPCIAITAGDSRRLDFGVQCHSI